MASAANDVDSRLLKHLKTLRNALSILKKLEVCSQLLYRAAMVAPCTCYCYLMQNISDEELSAVAELAPAANEIEMQLGERG